MRRKIFYVIASVAMVATIMASSDLRAQAKAAVPGDGEVRERLTHIDSALKEGQFTANLWYWGWVGGYSALAATQLTLYFTKPDVLADTENHGKQDMMAGFITTVLGIGGLAIDPMVPGYALSRYRDMPSGTAEERLEKLKQAEYWLKKSSRREIDGRGWLNHVLNFAVNFTAGMVIWLGFNRPHLDFWLTFGPGFVIGEAQIFTQPTRAISDWERYQRKHMMASVPGRETSLNWFMAAYPGGFIVGMHF